MKQGRGLTGRLKRIAKLSAPPSGLLANRALELLNLERTRAGQGTFVRAGRRSQRFMARSATWKCGWQATAPTFCKRSGCATKFSTKKCPRRPNPVASMRRLDQDAYDAVCDHLLVVDTSPEPHGRERWAHRRRPRVVGTYRLLRQDIADRTLGFYSQAEYDIAPLVRSKSPRYRFMELGRSCVMKPYRSKRSVELLWHGLWTYVREHKVDVMIGCASFEGTDPAGTCDGSFIPASLCHGAGRLALRGACASASENGSHRKGQD